MVGARDLPRGLDRPPECSTDAQRKGRLPGPVRASDHDAASRSGGTLVHGKILTRILREPRRPRPRQRSDPSAARRRHKAHTRTGDAPEPPEAAATAKWWLPDEVVFIEAVPKTSVGKFDKKVLRERFKAWTPPGL